MTDRPALQADQFFRYDFFAEPDDPYRDFSVLRESYPVYRTWRITAGVPEPVWLISRFLDVQTAARDWQTFSSIRRGASVVPSPELVASDPPWHDEVRGLLSGLFDSRALREDLAPLVQDAARDVAEALPPRGTFDAATEIAWKLPIAVSSELLGLPSSDRPWLTSVTMRLAEPGYATDTRLGESKAAHEEWLRYFAEIVQARRRHPGGSDLLSRLVDAQPSFGPLSQGILEQMSMLLFEASTHTTAALLGNTLALLAERPDDRRWLRDHPDGWAAAIEESLRFESPVTHMLRRTTRNADIGGHQIPMGDEVALLFASANRDVRQFASPDTFNIHRPPGRHLAFGDGIHFCLGAGLARLEARTLLPMVLDKLGDFEVMDGARRLRATITRGWAELPLRVNEAAA